MTIAESGGRDAWQLLLTELAVAVSHASDCICVGNGNAGKLTAPMEASAAIAAGRDDGGVAKPAPACSVSC